jgi:hypothetical protein
MNEAGGDGLPVNVAGNFRRAGLERVAFRRINLFWKTPEAAFALQMRSGGFLKSI